MEYSYELKIPTARVPMLIGSRGETKRKIEKETGTKLTIDSKEGDVFLMAEDGLALFTAREIVTCIGRGFNPDVALNLLKADYSFEQINLGEFAKTKNHLIRLRGRLIGADGKSRELMEELTETNISIFGKTISIVGRTEHVAVAHRAIEKLVQGSQHSTVYRFLERQRREMKKREILGE